MKTGSDLMMAPAAEWARIHFGRLEFGDARLSKRAQGIAENMALAPGKSIPKQQSGWNETKRSYDFMNNPKVTPDCIQMTHRTTTLEELGKVPVSLLIEDSSAFIWSGKEPISGLGMVGPSKPGDGRQGFYLHTVMAAKWNQDMDFGRTTKRPPLEILGIPHQEFYVRKPNPVGPKETSRQRKSRARESQLWTRSSFYLGEAPQQVRWVRVCDRGSDCYEFLKSCLDFNHGFVIRASRDRVLVDPNSGKRADRRLFETARQGQHLGRLALRLRSRKHQVTQKKSVKQEARTARLDVSACQVNLRSPHRVGHGPGYDPPIPCHVIRVHEIDPPEDVLHPIEWILLCDDDVTTLEEAAERIAQYSSRWIIEEYHKVLKSGLGAEKLLFETAHALFAAIAFKAVVALRVLDLKEVLRVKAEAPANQSGVSDLGIRVLQTKLGRRLNTVTDVALAIGQLGGHLGRKADGMPGWKTLSIGMHELLLLVEGVRLAQQLISEENE